MCHYFFQILISIATEQRKTKEERARVKQAFRGSQFVPLIKLSLFEFMVKLNCIETFARAFMLLTNSNSATCFCSNELCYQQTKLTNRQCYEYLLRQSQLRTDVPDYQQPVTVFESSEKVLRVTGVRNSSTFVTSYNFFSALFQFHLLYFMTQHIKIWTEVLVDNLTNLSETNKDYYREIQIY